VISTATGTKSEVLDHCMNVVLSDEEDGATSDGESSTM
jgi:hypothetical protein